MRSLQRLVAVATIAAVARAPTLAQALSFGLDPLSSSLTIIGSGPENVFQPGFPLPGPGPLPPPSVGLSASDLGLLPGDMVDALSYSDDGVGTIYFTVSRGSAGVAGPLTPDVFSEVTPATPAPTSTATATASSPTPAASASTTVRSSSILGRRTATATA